jgi:hypothetical protein
MGAERKTFFQAESTLEGEPNQFGERAGGISAVAAKRVDFRAQLSGMLGKMQ